MEYNLFTQETETILKELNEVKMTYKKNDNVMERQITRSHDIDDLARELWPVDINYTEAMMTVFLNNSNKTIGYSILSIGGMTGTLVDIRILCQQALLTHATAVIMVHNHPSGALRASQADKEITSKVKKALKFLHSPV